jgi:hypothetical protein
MPLMTPDAAGRELARVRVQVRRERERLAAHVKTAKGRIDALEERADQLCAIANGEEQQTELDTTAATLAEAGRVDRRKGGAT